jgi:hypothetical protein
MRLVAARQLARLLAVAGGQAALDPGLLGEQQPEAPMHDLVVVDDQDAQAAPVHRVVVHASASSAIGTTSRTRQS